MKKYDICFMSACEMADAIKRQEFTSEEITETIIERIDCSFKIKRYDNVSRMTREIYDTLKSISLEYEVLKSEQNFEYYPIDMDFTFWFVPKYCENNECIKCPFGPNGFKCDFNSKICSFYENDKIKCIGKINCPIFNKKGMGMCGLSF